VVEPYTAEQRVGIIAKVLAGLRLGTPLTVICSEDGMPCDDTVRNWADGDDKLARDIARAREVGFDQIALDALAIADETKFDTKNLDNGQVAPNSEWITRSRLRVDTRLKLLAKWDPKRYGDKTLVGSDPDNPLPAGFSVSLVKPGDAKG
jgi:hypothetical protein